MVWPWCGPERFETRERLCALWPACCRSGAAVGRGLVAWVGGPPQRETMRASAAARVGSKAGRSKQRCSRQGAVWRQVEGHGGKKGRRAAKETEGEEEEAMEEEEEEEEEEWGGIGLMLEDRPLTTSVLLRPKTPPTNNKPARDWH
eukprot:631945-Rhodomonas_salina.1